MLLSVQAFSQCKTYMIGVHHDTLDCTDTKNLKQGKWVVQVPSLRGEPGYEEEGVFIDDKKEGRWRRYTLQGDVLAIENYKYGYKNGLCDYYNINGIEHEESWKATNPEQPYDTIQVPDLQDDSKIYLRVIKVDASTTEHGTWTYYDSDRGTIIKTEEYILGQKVDPITKKPIGLNKNASYTTGAVPPQLARHDAPATAKVAPPPEVKAFEKKNAGKKKVVVRDGATGN